MENLFQNQNAIYLIYLGIGVGVLLAVSALAQLIGRGESGSEARSRRMKLVAAGQSTEERLAILRPPPKEGLWSRIPVFGSLPQDLRRAGLSIRPDTFLIGSVALGAVIAMSIIPFSTPLLATFIGVSLGLLVPLAAVRMKIARQNKALLMQLPDALDMMARGLKVGHPLSTSIGTVARQMNDPIGTEFGIIHDQVSYGDDLPDAFHEFAERVDLEDAYYLSASIGIQHGTGGDLARVLEVLASVIRGRITMRRKIKAISAEGRASTYILTAVPIGLYGFTSFAAPQFYGEVKDDPLYLPMMGIVIVLVALNGIILRKLVDFRI